MFCRFKLKDLFTLPNISHGQMVMISHSKKNVMFKIMTFHHKHTHADTVKFTRLPEACSSSCNCVQCLSSELKVKDNCCYQSLDLEAVLHSLGLFVEKQGFSQTHCARHFKRSINQVKVLCCEAEDLVFASCLLECPPSSSVVKFGTLISFSFSSCKCIETYLCGLPAQEPASNPCGHQLGDLFNVHSVQIKARPALTTDSAQEQTLKNENILSVVSSCLSLMSYLIYFHHLFAQSTNY